MPWWSTNGSRWWEGDVVQLTQVFQNLIGNAIKFRGSAPPRINIGAQAE